jgi:hypothetical protein
LKLNLAGNNMIYTSWAVSNGPSIILLLYPIIPPTLSPFMNTLPFINTNGLWKLDMPALMDPIMPSTNQLILVEAGIVTILDTLSANLFTSLTLEFHYQPIHPYDALLIKEGVRYKCVSLMKKDRDFMVWFPPPCIQGNDRQS